MCDRNAAREATMVVGGHLYENLDDTPFENGLGRDIIVFAVERTMAAAAHRMVQAIGA